MTRMRNTLALIVTAGFLGTLAAIFTGYTPGADQTTQMMLGSLTTAWGMVLQWHFGSSAGSERKTDLLAAAPAMPVTPPPASALAPDHPPKE